MPRLLVMRGDVLEQEIELGGETVRIGRANTNDVILGDAGKSVSREHAELRPQGGRYVLVDLQSQNGIWVSGNRMPQVVLDPNIVATIGPYRLVLETGGATASGPMTAYEPGGRSSRDSDEEEDFGTGAGSHREAAPGKTPKATQSRPWYRQYQMPIAAGAAAVTLGGGIFAVWALRRTGDSPSAVDRLPEAERLIANDECAKALDEIIGPALQQDPGNPEAIRLEAEADGCLPAPAKPPDTPVTPVPEQDIDSLVVDVRRALAARPRDCAGAQRGLDQILAIAADNPSVGALRREVADCAAVVRTPGPPPVPPAGGSARPIPPEQGGLALALGESTDSYVARIAAMEARFREADASLAKDDLKRALSQFESIAREAGPTYRYKGDAAANVTDRIRTIRTRLKEAARRQFDAAVDLEEHSEFNRALEGYRQAGQSDPDLPVGAAIERVTAAKTAAGRKFCDAADVSYKFRNYSKAAGEYKQAAELLPQSDPCYAVANERKVNGGAP